MEYRSEVERKIQLLITAFSDVLYEEDETFLKNMETHNLAGDDIRKYQFWEWTQGVGLFGLWKLFERKGEARILEILKKYYDRQLEIGFPALNVNTAAPYLAMSYLAEYTKEEKYMGPCVEAAEWIMDWFPRTREGGFQHVTSDSLNSQELWDDTLYMTVLFLANMGRILEKEEMLEEARYQFLLHAGYLADKKTGLWYHGWTFQGMHNFAGAFWGRGNCWITMAIPEFLAMVPCENVCRRTLIGLLERQLESLQKYQDSQGMWHTLIDDPTSYAEASATCGFAYGALKAVRDGLVDVKYRQMAEKALPAVLECITEDGVVEQVSYGTPMGRISKDFYKQIPLKSMPYGQALALLFLIEFQECMPV